MTDKLKNCRELLDSDGENLAVRWFLALYSGTNNPTVEQMRKHLDACGFPLWPAWAQFESGHLTKGGAQDWLRHLFSLESRTEPAGSAEPSVCQNCDGSGIGDYVDHGFAQYGEQAIEPVRCEVCEGSGIEPHNPLCSSNWKSANGACNCNTATQSTHQQDVSKSAGEIDMEKEREEFEKDVIWRLGDDPSLLYRRTMPGAMFYGEYVNEKIQRHWLGWQARALLAAKGGE